MFRNKIFIVGHANVGKLEFVKGAFKSSETEFPESLVEDQLKELNGSHAGLRIPWTIDTKYYTANVDFWLDEIAPDTIEKDIKAYTEQSHGITEAIDAFVYVFRKDKPETFSSLRSWLPFLEKCDPSIRLCVGKTEKNAQKTNSKETIDYEEWCLDNEFEYIDLDETTEDPLDKAGVELAVEVLKTNMWDGSTHKDTVGQKPHKPEYKDDNALDEDDDEEEFYRELQKLNIKHDRHDQSDETNDDLGLPNQDEINMMKNQLFGDLDGEDGLDKAFETLNAMREKGKDLPDAERRKLAAQVALSFAAQLGV
ncbi:hypothetical protein J3Q64DRAFT_1732466 [Phycomyces blakesleeanus]|uniref:Increased recombination centers protein 6 n=2 Tax=Phycomyces blakesleeanus TaxID=4837 RepID=A0A162PQU3_PHYB8|nr:hypothetical protein PHYBLDRAFT_147046 [Phycomyces blakesleeanus NRRL 1555(-)]OAD72066.1 hypothetical protein PHYBLDRAFT_147046 [Phycomyces blakesleeanus NRRL 1555(-)]|eukprot:XP_018290106.1 hypothetical protein PHYBLDRAFT_147046 [Phycomyces blakesleeanus NRRL 1555(-)]